MTAQQIATFRKGQPVQWRTMFDETRYGYFQQLEPGRTHAAVLAANGIVRIPIAQLELWDGACRNPPFGP